jgi:altronate hydrolase
MQSYLKIHQSDNVAVAVEGLKKGASVSLDGALIILRNDIPAGHKFALCDISAGEKIIKYGFPIGHAAENIPMGSHVHTHNVRSDLNSLLEYQYQPRFTELTPLVPQTFRGFKRPDGKVGIRNEVWIIPTVGCVNAIAKQIEVEAQKFIRGGLEAVVAYSHPYGCSQLGGDLLNTQKALCGLIRHPNAAGVLVLGLGCEHNRISEMKKVLGPYDEDRVKFLVSQEVDDEVEAALNLLKELCGRAAGCVREEISASELVLGLKCGGSDGFSGITANPLVGSLSDRLIAQGGSAILTEVPEMFGAETLLMQRCRSREVFDKTVTLINDFKSYFINHNEPIDENPAPGNKDGGITTLEDKSLGCVQKGGTAPVEDVLAYGELVHKKGLSLLQSPGNDLVATNALMFSGVHLVLFTTGRGTPFGCAVPTVKIASNSDMALRKRNWIDFDAGRLVEGETMESLTAELFQLVLDIASGEKKAKSEALDKRDLTIFKDGVTV